jgi:endonuclease/exonuclease/phosphatase family metal-dependent hydrolase
MARTALLISMLFTLLPALSLAAAPTFRVVTYNLHRGEGFKDPAGFARFLNEDSRVGPFDVLGVQELCGNNGQKQVDDLTAILAKKGPIYTYFVSSDPTDTKECGKGQAIFSRHPILGSGFRMLPFVREWRVMVWVDLEVAGRPVRVYDLHLDSRANNFFKSASERRKQILGVNADFIEFRKEHPNTATFVTGDFNSWNHVVDIGSQEACIKEMRKNFEPSIDHFVTTMVPWQLDWIFSDAAEIVRSEVIRDGRFSDHYAVYADYDL